MNTAILPRDFKELSKQSANAPSELTLVAPDKPKELAERIETIFSLLHNRGDSDEALQLKIKVETVDRPDNGLLIKGKATADFGQGTEFQVEALYRADEELESLAIDAPSPDAGGTFSLGKGSGANVRIHKIRWYPGLKNDNELGYLIGDLTIASIALPIRITVADDKTWTLLVFPTLEAALDVAEKSAQAKPPEALHLAKLFDEWAEFKTIQALLNVPPLNELRESSLQISELRAEYSSHGINPAFYRVRVGGLKPWKITDTFQISDVEASLGLRYKPEWENARMEVELAGTFVIGDAKIAIGLSKYDDSWLLRLRKPITMAQLGTWLGARDFVANPPNWLPSLNSLEIKDLALGVDLLPKGASVKLLRGSLEWNQSEIPFHIAIGKFSVAFTKASFGISIENPFGERKTTLSLFARTKVGSGAKDNFELSGKITSSGFWELQATIKGALSLSTALDAFVAFTLDKPDFFGNTELLLQNPSLAFKNDGYFDIRTSVVVRKNAPASTSGVQVTIKEGRLAFTRKFAKGEKTCLLQTGVDLQFDSGMKLACSLWIDYDSTRKATPTSVTLNTHLDVPNGQEKPIQVDLTGKYTSGPQGGFSFKGWVSDVPLNPIIDGMLKPLDTQLPSNFPKLTVERLTLELDTAGEGKYAASGIAKAAQFYIDKVEIVEATLAFQVQSSVKKGKRSQASVKLAGQAKIRRSKVADPKDDLAITLRIEFDGEKSDYVATIEKLMVSDFVGIFSPGFQAPKKEDDFEIKQLGFRYRADKLEDKGEEKNLSDKETKKIVPQNTLAFFTDWNVVGRFDLALAKKDQNDKYHALILARPKLPWLPDAKVSWAGAPFDDVPLGIANVPVDLQEDLPKSTAKFNKGLALEAKLVLKDTVIDKYLHVAESITVKVSDKLEIGLEGKDPLVIGGKVKDTSKDKKNNESKDDKNNEEPSKDLAPAKDKDKDKDSSDEPGARLDASISLKTVLDIVVPAKKGAKTAGTWREYVGNLVVVSNVGLTLRSTPKPGMAMYADIGVNVGTWVSVNVKAFTVGFTPKTLSAEGLEDLKTDFALEGGSIAIDIPRVLKGSAAVLVDRKSDDGLKIVGMGELQILEKIRIGALVYLHWEKKAGDYQFKSAFGFVCATGLAIAIPPVMITGIAGGFGYNAVPKLPDKPEDVPKNPLIQLMRGGKSLKNAADAEKMVARFKDAIVTREGAWCVVLGMTFTVAQAVDGAVLLMVESRPTGLELALMGVATFTLGAKSGDKSKILGEIELSLLARFSMSAGSLMILGALTGDSWVFDRDCRIKGAFAICYWFKGDNAGDFLISVGGYSPLAKKRDHYPALERVGFSWQMSEKAFISAEAYFALDRHGIQLGFKGQLKYDTPKLKVDALFSLDALAEWSPFFFEVQMRISVHVEARLSTTIRLGLDVDLYAWGPPYGMKARVEIDLWLIKPAFTVELGATREQAEAAKKRPSLLQFANQVRGDRPSILALKSGGHVARCIDAHQGEKAEEEKATVARKFDFDKPCRPDDARLIVESAIPLKTVKFQGQEENSTPTLDLRPSDKRDVQSVMVITSKSLRGDLHEPQWRLIKEEQPVAEALWCIPADAKNPWDEPRRKFTTVVRIEPVGTEGTQETQVKHTLAPDTKTPETTTTLTLKAASGHVRPAESSDQAIAALKKNRTGLQQALLGNFDIEDCEADDFRTIEETPMVAA